MITLTLLTKIPIVVNCDHIATIESCASTRVTLADGRWFDVIETPDQIEVIARKNYLRWTEHLGRREES